MMRFPAAAGDGPAFEPVAAVGRPFLAIPSHRRAHDHRIHGNGCTSSEDSAPQFDQRSPASGSRQAQPEALCPPYASIALG
jgi:hypothetical protein